ncbi:hypothetical protein M0R04_15810 [Candidatus Dojkabacteria bacterium]|jgi:uncharacterized small protein (DUF1192 family)|nr:hypothetical protein [Candidatus Dojkabacteria bacterium]
MITKKDFEDEKVKLEKAIEEEKHTMDLVVMNVNKITAALQWVNSEIAKFPAEPEKKKKSLFGKK